MQSIHTIPRQVGRGPLHGRSLNDYVRASGGQVKITPALARIARVLSGELLGSAAQYASAKNSAGRGSAVKQAVAGIARSEKAKGAIRQLKAADMRSALAVAGIKGRASRVNAAVWASLLAAAVAAINDPSWLPLAGAGGLLGIIEDGVTLSEEALAELGTTAVEAEEGVALTEAGGGLLAAVAEAFGALAAASPAMAIGVVVVVVLVAVAAVNAVTGWFW